ncbi:hypothetical protein M427DRAFT_46899 [Gonapodya prolifera JEL478]|uniref:tRNA-binding domain-containing protein n=1 Tax=Gonapodya prolifera (strain JEL478) TaxID=1344416 RepID=A0A139A5U3_GONPJ|nr:hypothetical protein M427DRAFT_46899 [Gonapodya prolifera JEL478]|eukprot:KXS11733.1 hypothetical protein M427DRAFT_46899 [Gonapodya prolifera JEL478]
MIYVLSLYVGDNNGPRTVCSGLVPFMTAEDLLKLDTVVAVCNLKPAKIRGVESQAMLLAASPPPSDSSLTPDRPTAISVLRPPPDCAPGDPVFFASHRPAFFESHRASTGNQFKKVGRTNWDLIRKGLRVAGDRNICWESEGSDIPADIMITNKGNVKCQEDWTGGEVS